MVYYEHCTYSAGEFFFAATVFENVHSTLLAAVSLTCRPKVNFPVFEHEALQSSSSTLAKGCLSHK